MPPTRRRAGVPPLRLRLGFRPVQLSGAGEEDKQRGGGDKKIERGSLKKSFSLACSCVRASERRDLVWFALCGEKEAKRGGRREVRFLLFHDILLVRDSIHRYLHI